MKRLWQIWIKALEYGIDTDELFFNVGATFSPYSEVTLKSFEAWNEEFFHNEIAVNPFFQHDDIFCHLLVPAQNGYDKLTLAVCDMIFHHLAGIDAMSGMTKEDFYIDFIADDIEQGVFGNDERVKLFDRQEKRYLARQLLRLYQTNQYSFCLSRAVEHIFPSARVNLAEQGRIMIFMNREEKKERKNKIDFLTELFLKADQKAELYWVRLPGVIGRFETMAVEEFLIG